MRSFRIRVTLLLALASMEHQTLELRADSQNLLNKVNFNKPGATTSATNTFGLITSGSQARTMQFAVKYMF